MLSTENCAFRHSLSEQSQLPKAEVRLDREEVGMVSKKFTLKSIGKRDSSSMGMKSNRLTLTILKNMNTGHDYIGNAHREKEEKVMKR